MAVVGHEVRTLGAASKAKVICVHCSKERGNHKAVSLHCPDGPRTRIGYLKYHAENTFTPAERKDREGR